LKTGKWYVYLNNYGLSKLEESNYINLVICNAPTQTTFTVPQKTSTEEHLKAARWPVQIEDTHNVQAFTQEHIVVYDCDFHHWSVQWYYSRKLEYTPVFKNSHSNIQLAATGSCDTL